MSLRYLDLAAPQQHLLEELEFGGTHLVTGPPGSGKTTIALHWAVMLALAGERVRLLTRSRLLAKQLETRLSWLSEGANVRVGTVHEWLYERFKFSYTATDDGWPDWGALCAKPATRSEPAMVVDEGQDLPSGFYDLARVRGARLTVFADECQRLGSNQSTLTEIAAAIGAAPMMRLPGGHRVPDAVVDLIDWLEGADAPGAAPIPGTRPEIHAIADVPGLASFILQLNRKHPNQRIGVVFGSTTEHERLEAEVRQRGRHLNLQSYRAQPPGPLRVDPSRPGLLLVNRRSVKGLEFNIVVIADTHIDAAIDPTDPGLRLTYAMLAARTGDQLHLCYQGSREPPLLARIPTHIARREPESAHRALA